MLTVAERNWNFIISYRPEISDFLAFCSSYIAYNLLDVIINWKIREALQLQKDHHAWNKYLDVVLNIFYVVVWKVHGLTLF